MNSFNEIQNYFYTVLNADSSIKYIYIYIYSKKQETISLNDLKDISETGEFKFQIKKNSSEKNYYQINKCSYNKNLYFSFGNSYYNNVENEFYGIQKKIESNMFFSIINEGGNQKKPQMYFWFLERVIIIMII